HRLDGHGLAYLRPDAGGHRGGAVVRFETRECHIRPHPEEPAEAERRRASRRARTAEAAATDLGCTRDRRIKCTRRLKPTCVFETRGFAALLTMRRRTDGVIWPGCRRVPRAASIWRYRRRAPSAIRRPTGRT